MTHPHAQHHGHHHHDADSAQAEILELDAEVLAEADILCMPSSSEGMPVAAVEALRHGLAIAGTDALGFNPTLPITFRSPMTVMPQLMVRSIFNARRGLLSGPLSLALAWLSCLTAASKMVLNFVASARGVGDVGTKLLLPWILCAAFMVSLSGDEESGSPSSSSESLSASDGEYGGGGAVSSGFGF